MTTHDEVARVLSEAHDLSRSGRFDVALDVFERAEPRVRERFAAEPEAHAYGLGSLLYNKAACLSALHRTQDCLGALEEAERCYEQSREQRARADLLIADVWVRRAIAQSRRGFFVSAAAELERAILAYADGPAGAAPALDTARVLASGAVHAGDCVDPDLASARADLAAMRYLGPAVTYGDLCSAGNLPVIALECASEIHAANGRLQLALEADTLAVHLARRFKEIGAPWAAELLARQLATSGVHQQANGQVEAATQQLREAESLDPAAVEWAKKRWAIVEKGAARSQNTLARAINNARRQLGRDRVPERLDKVLVRSPIVEAGALPLLTSAERCDPQVGLVLATQLSELALALTASDGTAALRLGTEAHLLWLSASRAQTWAMRYSFSEVGAPWARLLLHLSRFLGTQQQHELALDFAGSACAVSERLIPFRSLLDSQVFDEIVKGSMAHHAELLAAADDATGAHYWREAVRRLG